jgi:hypothetical protein
VTAKHAEEGAENDQHDRDKKNELANHVHSRRELTFHGLCLPFKGASAKSS